MCSQVLAGARDDHEELPSAKTRVDLSPRMRGRCPSAVAGYARLCCTSENPRRACHPERSEGSAVLARRANVKLSCVAFREPRHPLESSQPVQPLRHAGPSESARSPPIASRLLRVASPTTDYSTSSLQPG